MKTLFLLLLATSALLYNCNGQNIPAQRIKMASHGDLIDARGPIDSTIYSGTYNGKNLFFKNEGFCIKSILVNGQVNTDSVDSRAFEIDFKKLNIKQGDNVSVKIMHPRNCKNFKCLNEEVLH